MTMATTPEEFFVRGLKEQSPPSPPLFLDLPQELNGSSEGGHPNDMMLPYLSRVLLEDDIDDKLNDHPGLLQVQQPFAQILSSPSFGTNTSKIEVSNNLLEYAGPNERAHINSALSKGTEVVHAFLKGMEEANMLLPKENKYGGDKQVSQTVQECSNRSGVKRYNRDDHLEEEIRRTRKAATVVKDLEENCANKMLDEMMLYAYETCIRGMDKLRLMMDNEADKNNRKGRGSKARRDNDNVVDIRTMLISCAQAVSENDHMRARELLEKINKHASATGDAAQRLAHCFTKGLQARLLGSGSQIWKLHVAEKTSVVDYLKAYKLYSAACCFNKVAFIYSTMTIMEAMEGKSRLHIVDYGMDFGFQWAGLLRSLASREDGLPEVKITAIGHPRLKFCPAERIEETECRLRKCARVFGLPSFKFRKIMKKWEDVCIEDLDKEDDEVLVVNDIFNFSTLMDETVNFQERSPRDTVLNNITKMRPHVFIQTVLNCSCGFSFVTRFREALFYYMALFDILDATIPRESKSRLVLEEVVLGRSALNVIACEGADLVDRPEKYRQWQARNQRAGLRQLLLKSSMVDELKNKVQKHHQKDFLICVDGQWLLQGWMGRVLFAHSTWVAEEKAPPLDAV